MIIKKKGAGETNWIVIFLVIALVVFLIYSGVLRFIPGVFGPLTTCRDRGACFEGGMGYGCPEGYYNDYALRCPQETQICCVPSNEMVGERFKDMNTKEREAVLNAFILSFERNPAELSAIELKAEHSYEMKLTLNRKLPKAYVDPIVIYVSDRNNPNKRYYFQTIEQGKKPDASETNDLILTPEGGDNQFSFGSDLFTTMKPGDAIHFRYNPSLADSYKELELHVVLFDNKEVEEDRQKAIKSGDVPEEFKNLPRPLYPVANFLSEVAWNEQYWLAQRTYPIYIAQTLEIRGLSGAWVAKDDVSIVCEDLGCKKIELKLVKSAEGSFDELVDNCKSESYGKFDGVLHQITGTTLERKGIPLNLNIGGFRIPTQSVQLKYITQEAPINVIKGKADVVIDKSTMLKDFYTGNNEDLFIGENTHLCAKALVGDDHKETIYAVSETPLMVDVLPPVVPQESIEVKHPDLFINDPLGTYGDRYPSVRNQPYFYKQYPRVVVGFCQDWGQSGCAYYDYYTHTGNFIDLRSYTADWETALKAFIITKGLNELMNYFAKKDPLNTICPYIHSNQYRRNSFNEIRYRSEGQGIMCIRVSDRVGNAVIVWKEIWTPEDMFKRIALESALNATGLA